MYQTDKEKRKKKNNGRNKIAKWRKHLNTWRKLEIPGNIRSERHQTETKEKVRKEYLRRKGKFPETKSCSRNLIKGINTWAVSLVRYSGSFLEWTREEITPMDHIVIDDDTYSLHSSLHYVARNKEANTPALKIAWIQFKDSNNIQKWKEIMIIAANINRINLKSNRKTANKKSSQQKWEEN